MIKILTGRQKVGFLSASRLFKRGAGCLDRIENIALNSEYTFYENQKLSQACRRIQRRFESALSAYSPLVSIDYIRKLRKNSSLVYFLTNPFVYIYKACKAILTKTFCIHQKS